MVRSGSPCRLMFVLLVFSAVSNTTVKIATTADASQVSPSQKTDCNNMYTYNNFCSRSNKKVEVPLPEVKKELIQMMNEIKSLKGNQTIATGTNKKIEALLHDVKNELGEMREEIKSLKENKTITKGTNKKIEALLHGVKNELGEMREEIKSLKENKTITTETGTNKTIKAFLFGIEKELSKMDNKIKCLKTKKAILKVFKNCAEAYKAGKRVSGVYTINPDNAGAFDVFCDQTTAGGGWTVFQKRLDGSVDFYRGWDDYKRGFGNLNGEFWLGLDKIHRLTKEKHKLRVELEDTNRKTAYAEYSYFGVANEGSKYKLSLGKYSGTAGDSLSYHRGCAFSTKDRDNDNSAGHCVTHYKSPWWYNSCVRSTLNGPYHPGKLTNSWQGVVWYHWKGHSYSAKRAEMKIKPVNN